MKLFETDPDGTNEELFEDLPADPVSESQARSTLHGKEFDQEAFQFLEASGATIIERYPRFGHYHLDALIEGANGRRFYIDAHGTPDRADRHQAGMRRTDTILKFGFKALRLQDRRCPHPLILITSHLPKPGTASAFFLTEVNDAVFDAVATVGDFPGQRRLQAYLTTTPPPPVPLPAPWREVQLAFDIDPFADDRDAPDA